ncbi:MAG: glycosyl hydrolase 53 family protein [Bacteroidia bacterium]|nr:glycosyl hydrolase 53 family protein [Bacteroidia bacterium]
MKPYIFLLATLLPYAVLGQNFYFGNDLSYVNQMEDCGADFKENGVSKDVYQIFADHGTNLVRVRLWVDPAWQNSLVQPVGVKPQYSDFADVKETISRAKAAGMQVILDFHYSDFWADPGRQLIPARWLSVANNLPALKDSVYSYTVKVLSGLEKEGLMPEIVTVGNENNGGILRHTTMDNNYVAGGSVSNDWNRDAQLYNAAIQAIRAVGDTAAINPKIAVHFSGLNTKWFFQNLITLGVTDFDIMGFSYYYAWHGGSISQLGTFVEDLVASFPGYEMVALETGYPWTTQNFDAMPNIITAADPAYSPLSPEKQLSYLVDYTKEVMVSGGSGVIFWEPAWVSTPCRTPWGQGSSHDHVVFFDPVNYNFINNGGGRWTEPLFYQNLTTPKVTFMVDMAGEDVSNGVYITGTFTGATNWLILPMSHYSGSIYKYSTQIPAGSTGAYYYLTTGSWTNYLDYRETVPAACAEWWDSDRGYVIPGHDTTFAVKWESCETFAAGIRDNLLSQQISIYPNPASDKLYLSFSEGFVPTSLDITLSDIQGKTLKTWKKAGPVGSDHDLTLPVLPTGIYLLRIFDGENTAVWRVMF